MHTGEDVGTYIVCSSRPIEIALIFFIFFFCVFVLLRSPFVYCLYGFKVQENHCGWPSLQNRFNQLDLPKQIRLTFRQDNLQNRHVFFQQFLPSGSEFFFCLRLDVLRLVHPCVTVQRRQDVLGMTWLGDTPIAGWFLLGKIPARNGWWLGIPPIFRQPQIVTW